MDTNIDFGGDLNFIDSADDSTAKNILEMLEMRQSSLWFGSEAAGDVSDVIDLLSNDQRILTFDQVKQLYPDWFNE